MLYFLGVLALSLLVGVQGQLEMPVPGTCQGQAIENTYTYCGRFGDVNVYWTPAPPNVNILFEAVDDQMMAFGFTSVVGAGAMNGANVVVGCQNFANNNMPLEVNLPAAGVARNPNTVLAGVGQNQLAVQELQEVRMNGICGVRFTRLAILADVTVNATIIDVNDAHNVVSGTPNAVVWARGNQTQLMQHLVASRGSASQDFLLGFGDITGTQPPVDNGNGNGVARAASAAAPLIVSAFIVAAAMW